MSIRALHVPEAQAISVADDLMVPSAVPVDEHGRAQIPELDGRDPTAQEQQIITGDPITLGSTNVDEIFWNWENQNLFVRFLSGDLYVFYKVPLSVVVGMVNTDSPGRYVHNHLNGLFDYDRLVKSNTPRKKPNIVRLVN